MKKFIVLAAAAAACSTSAFAQVSNFTGPSVGVNLDHTAVSNQITDASTDLDGLGQQSVGVSLQAAYGFDLSPSSVLSIGATYSLTDAKAGHIKDNSTVTFKGKNAYSIYLEPGVLISDKTLAYGKVSYESVKMSAEDTGGSDSKNINGVGYGFGIRTMLDKAWSLQAEVKHVKYGSEALDSTTTFKTSATIGTIGLGYKF